MLPGFVLALLVLVAGTLSFTSWPGVATLVVVSVWWARVNKPVEGPVWWTFPFAPTHGFTAADLAGLAGLLVAVVRAVQLLRA